MPGVSSHSNSFDALRLLAAFAVVVGHAYVLTGALGQVPSPFGIAIHGLGVAVFFAISGFLVTDSWLRNPQPSVFFASRALRILPALALVVIATIFVIGPIFTTLPLAQYFASSQTWLYAANLLPLVPQYELPGVFAGLPYPDAVNGSLWTLRAEIACYLVVGCLLIVPRVLRAPTLALFGGASIVIAVSNVTIADSNLSAAATTWVFFSAGALLRLLSQRWRVIRIEIAAVVLAGWIVLSLTTPINPDVLAWLGLPYCVIAVGQLSIPGVRRAARFGDLSYGLYLWAFPVQQGLVQLGFSISIALDIVIVTVVAGAFAMISWHAVESPALRLKSHVRAAASRRAHDGASADSPTGGGVDGDGVVSEPTT